MAAFSSDFIGLPIIISDYDAIVAKSPTKPTFLSSANPAIDNTNQTTPTSESTNTNTTSTSSTPSSSSAANSITQMHTWTAGFADFADAVWNRMNFSMKQKLREACVEVLRRTEDPSEEERVFGGFGFDGEKGGWDEDARFLD